MNKKVSNFNVYLIVILILGVIMMLAGFKLTYERNQKAKDYIPVEATFIGTILYSSDEDGETYSLIYSYTVNGIKYEVKTDYGTSIIPKYGAKKQ